MRDLDAINPSFMRPSKFASFSAGTLLALAAISVPLAYGVAPDIPLGKNLVVLFICAIFGSAFVLAVMALIFRWGWEAKYYGVSLLCVAGISFLAIVPCLTAVLYGTAPYWIRTVILLFYGVSHFFWCRKFSILYKSVFDNKALRAVVYDEEADAVYYLRRGDDYLLNKYYKFSQMPQDRYFIGFIAVAFLMIPIMNSVCSFVGVPFVHVFLLVAMLPVSWMSIGLAVRAYLIFYLYPSRIKKATGKDVYVDLVSKHRPIEKYTNPIAVLNS